MTSVSRDGASRVFVYECPSSFIHEQIKQNLFTDVNNCSRVSYYFVVEERVVARWFIYFFVGGCFVQISAWEEGYDRWQ